jgi:hypothetical protein
MPTRHQRPSRGHLRGWRKPEGAIMITRPARWSNPYKIKPYGPYSRDEAIDRFEADLLAGRLVTGPGRDPLGVPDAARELAGKDLVCACGPDERCHGDVLLHWANAVNPGR